ncbi:hypothetical protein [Salana multivorans]
MSERNAALPGALIEALGADREREVDALVRECAATLGPVEAWPAAPPGYPRSLALCILDSIYSTGSHYTSVRRVVQRYRDAYGELDGAAQLLERVELAGGARLWAREVLVNRKPASTRPGAPMKAEVVEQAACLLVGLGIDSVEDLRLQVRGRPLDNPVLEGWEELPSQSSGVTYNYLLILAGLPSVKADRMVTRFLARAVGRPVKGGEAVRLVAATAGRLGVDIRRLDHVIWRAESNRAMEE